MDWADAQLLMTELAPVIRDFVAESLKPVVDRLTSLEGGPENIFVDGDIDELAVAEEFRRALAEIDPLGQSAGASPRWLTRYNPNHEPSGTPEGGQFAEGDGGTGGSPEGGQFASTADNGKPPKVLYHIVGPDWHEGEPLRNLYDQMGTDAYDEFARRWPDSGGLSEYHAHYIFFYNSLGEAREYAVEPEDRILAVDSAKVPNLRFDTLEAPGYWVAAHEPVPPEAITIVPSQSAADAAR